METECYTYIIKGKIDYYYCGITKDIHVRYFEHNKGQCKSTRKHTPYMIKFLKRFNTRKEARRLEVTIKDAGVQRWYQKNILHGNYPNEVITNLISGKKG